MPRHMFYGWKIVGVVALMALFAWGFGFYGVGVYLASLRAIHGWSTSLVSSAITLYYLVGALGVLFVSDAFARFGPRRVVVAGLLALGVGVAGLTLVTKPWHMYVAFIAMAVGWAATSGAAIQTIIAPWFERRRGLAISLAFNGATCGGIVVAPLLLLAISALGFARGIYVAVGVMLVVALPIVGVWLHRDPETLGLGPDGDAPGAAPERGRPGPPPGATWRRTMVLRRTNFWTIAIPFAMALAVQVGFITHQISFVQPIVGPARAGFAVALTTLAAVAGRLVTGAVIDRANRRVVSSVNFSVQLVALGVLVLAPTPILVYVACVLFGLGLGNLVTLPGLIVQQEFPKEQFARTVSLIVAGNQFTFAFGPGVMGFVHDLTGGYTVPFALGVLVDAVAAVLVLAKGRR